VSILAKENKETSEKDELKMFVMPMAISSWFGSIFVVVNPTETLRDGDVLCRKQSISTRPATTRRQRRHTSRRRMMVDTGIRGPRRERMSALTTGTPMCVNPDCIQSVRTDQGWSQGKASHGDSLENGDVVVGDLLAAKVNPGKDGENDDGKGRAKRVDEKRRSTDEVTPAMLIKVGAERADRVEEHQSGQAVRGITLG
jgi:hypothetical protein